MTIGADLLTGVQLFMFVIGGVTVIVALRLQVTLLKRSVEALERGVEKVDQRLVKYDRRLTRIEYKVGLGDGGDD